MPRSKRIVTCVGILLQGFAVYCLWSRSLVWPLMWPRDGMLLYSRSAALRRRRRTDERDADFGVCPQDPTGSRPDCRAADPADAHPAKVDRLPDYEVETFYKPFRDVGGDYFDVIELADKRTLFAVADVSGKGMPAALLAAKIQALVRSIASVDTDPLALARQINRHLSRYTPIDRFATAAFIVLHRDTGELTYVNAGHNAPIFSAPVCIARSHRYTPWSVS